MTDLITFIAAILSADNSGPVVFTLLLVFIFSLGTIIGWLLRDRKRLIKGLGDKDEQFLSLLEKYESGLHSVGAAMSSIKEVLIELRTIVTYRNGNNKSD